MSNLLNKMSKIVNFLIIAAGGGQTAAKTYFASWICCKDSPYQF